MEMSVTFAEPGKVAPLGVGGCYACDRTALERDLVPHTTGLVVQS